MNRRLCYREWGTGLQVSDLKVTQTRKLYLRERHSVGLNRLLRARSLVCRSLDPTATEHQFQGARAC